MEGFTFSVPQDIVAGKGSIAKLPEVVKKMGAAHAFIISGPHLNKIFQRLRKDDHCIIPSFFRLNAFCFLKCDNGLAASRASGNNQRTVKRSV